MAGAGYRLGLGDWQLPVDRGDTKKNSAKNNQGFHAGSFVAKKTRKSKGLAEAGLLPRIAVPFLQLHNVTLGVGHVKERQLPGTRDVDSYEVTVVVATHFFDLLAGCVYVIHLECQVREAGAVEGLGLVGRVFVESEYFNCRSVFAMSRHEQVAALDAYVWYRGHRVNLRTVMVAFGANWFAVEHLFIKSTKPSPVLGDDIHVGVSRGHGGR